ncbi:DUF3800 domain-containing protein [Fodinibius sp. Rm-B-1B1-1]|uniref:DUF3800 domain-containing protein n=1 Tax=Fodinibius alkaliphilus TaxID=3140241 RepID=UPI003159E9E6
MNYWFADHTDFRSKKGNRIPDIFILGGIVISKESLDQVSEIFRNIKSDYTHPNMPVKWNFRDLEDKYKEFGLEDDYQALLKNSKDWRKDIFSQLADTEYKIVLSCIENFQKKKDLDQVKYDLLRYSFSNALMRVGYCAYDTSSFSIILDWPDSHNPKPFNREFYYAYNKGQSVDGVPYYCGNLKELGFNDSVYFANMNHSIGLQLSDLVIGAFRDGIKSFRDDHYENIGIDTTKIYLEKLNGFKKDALMSRGVLVSKSNENFEECVAEFLKFLQ